MTPILAIFCCLLIVSANGLFFTDRENIIMVPSVAFRVHSPASSTDWSLYNQGWYYKEDSLKARVMEKTLETIVRKDLDLDRIRMFTGEGQKNKQICIDGLNRAMCIQTDSDGRIKNPFQMTDAEIRRFIQPNGPTGKVLYQVSNSRKTVKATGEVYLWDDNGVTFVSDIDDTIKITGVTSTTDTLINTFSGEFKAVPGMSTIYQTWQKKYNATFAYVTASPDQLYPFLRAFMDREKFPSGSAHMRHFTWLDVNFINFFMSSSYIQSKTNTLTMFMENTRNRKFVLIGDIFQKDPDIYSGIYAKYSNRIGHIFIRKYKNDTVGQQRLDQVFAQIPRNKWSTFESGADLPVTVPFL